MGNIVGQNIVIVNHTDYRLWAIHGFVWNLDQATKFSSEDSARFAIDGLNIHGRPAEIIDGNRIRLFPCR